MSNATATSVSASSSGSVIGVACRYSTFGLTANIADPSSAAAADPVRASTIQAIAAVATANEVIDIATAAAPVR